MLLDVSGGNTLLPYGAVVGLSKWVEFAVVIKT